MEEGLKTEFGGNNVMSISPEAVLGQTSSRIGKNPPCFQKSTRVSFDGLLPSFKTKNQRNDRRVFWMGGGFMVRAAETRDVSFHSPQQGVDDILSSVLA